MSEQPTRRGFLRRLALGVAAAGAGTSDSDDSTSDENSCEGPTCGNDNVLIIEVPGKDHPEGHHIRLYDLEDQQQQEWLENQVAQESTDTETLHVWDWQGQPNRNVWLEVDTEEGDPIRLPFLRDTGVVPRQTDVQPHEYHVLMPVVPMTLLSGVTREEDNPSYPVLSRPGYLYVFFQGELWRELEIRQDDNGETHYRDIRLLDHCDNDGHFTDSQRPAVGSPLQEIWLPARINNQWQTLEVAYSESQLPAPRLNRLEEDDSTRRVRCTEVDMEWQEQDFSQPNDATSNDTGTAFPLTSAPAQRPRDPGYEFQLDRPFDYLLDLSGNYPEQAMEAAREIQERHNDHKPNYRVHEDERPEMGAWACVVQEELQAERQQCGADDFCDGDWQAKGSADDALEAARERRIGGLVIGDPLYRFRYLQYRHGLGSRILDMVQELAESREYHDSAILVQTTLAPSQLDADENPLHKYYDTLSDDGKARAEKATGYAERRLTRQYLDRVQSDLLSALSAPLHEQSLGDLFCFDGWDYLGAFGFTAKLINCVLRSPVEMDSLYASTQVTTPDSPGKQWLRSICGSDCQSALGDMLWPQFNEGALHEPYTPPDEPEPNLGDGRYRATELARLEEQDEPDDELIRTIDGELVVNASRSGEFLTVLTSAFRSGTVAALAIHGEFHAAIESARQAQEQNRSEYQQLQRESRELQQRNVQLERDIADVARRRREGQQIHEFESQEIQQRQADIERTQEQLAQRQADINAQSRQASMRLYGRSVEQMRSATPGTFGDLMLERLSNANQTDYYIMGLDDVPEQSGNTVRMFGNIRENGQPVATTNQQRAQRFELPDAQAREVFVLVLPKNHQTAQLISDVTWAENQLANAHRELARASGNQAQAQAAVAEAEKELKTLAQRLGRIHDRSAQLLASSQATEDAIQSASARQQQAMNSRWYRMLNTPALPVVVLIAEGYNLTNVTRTFQEVLNQRGQWRAISGLASAGLDTGLALALLTERFAQNRLGAAVASHMSRDFGGRTVQALARRAGIERLILRGFYGGIAGFLVAGLSAADALHAMRMGNQAAWGYGTMAVGGLAMGAGALGVGAKSSLLFLGPKGWIALGFVLTFSGLGLAWWLDDEPMEVWLRHGPFGDLSELPHLKDALQAYYRLVGLLSGVSIQVVPNRLQPHARQESPPENVHPDDLEILRDATHVVRIQSPVASFFDNVTESEVAWHLRLNRKVVSIGSGNLTGSPTRSDTLLDGEKLDQAILGERETPTGWEIYVKTPRSHREETRRALGLYYRVDSTSYQWKVRAQARLTLEDDTLVFPAPLPDETNTQPDDSGEPDFSSTNQRFWANEETHGAS